MQTGRPAFQIGGLVRMRRRAPLFCGGNTRLHGLSRRAENGPMRQEETHANYSSGSNSAALGWILSRLAVQPGMGILSQRRFGLGGGHSSDFAFDGKNIVRARVCLAEYFPRVLQGDPAWEEG
jgi:hypothetical protein